MSKTYTELRGKRGLQKGIIKKVWPRKRLLTVGSGKSIEIVSSIISVPINLTCGTYYFVKSQDNAIGVVLIVFPEKQVEICTHSSPVISFREVSKELRMLYQPKFPSRAYVFSFFSAQWKLLVSSLLFFVWLFYLHSSNALSRASGGRGVAGGCLGGLTVVEAAIFIHTF